MDGAHIDSRSMAAVLADWFYGKPGPATKLVMAPYPASNATTYC
jgi:hypothetical protein